MSVVPGLVYNAMVSVSPLSTRRPLSGIWRRAWEALDRRIQSPVRTTIHGREVTVDFGYPYPVYARRFPHYNEPLLRATREAATANDRPAVVADVGAAVGDTALLLLSNCGTSVATIHCVEADPKFAALLRQNLAGLEKVVIHERLLADRSGSDVTVDMSHLGRPGGLTHAVSTTLDDEVSADLHVLKVDTDGFDGDVLQGSEQTLVRCAPLVLFEWHPKFYRRAGRDTQVPFAILADHGYGPFIWFQKTGEPHSVEAEWAPQLTAERAEECLRSSEDLHYDVVALPPGRAHSVDRLARMTFEPRSSPY